MKSQKEVEKMHKEKEIKITEKKEVKKAEDDKLYGQIPRVVVGSIKNVVDYYYEDARKDYLELQTKDKELQTRVKWHIFHHMESIKTCLDELEFNEYCKESGDGEYFDEDGYKDETETEPSQKKCRS